ncbi:MAG: hypothetical protein AVO34_02320 [Firmicutes bacterium ML8_F2]|nr:MAG: hypothetical protein AVO34_02320 [Firmicutes bacterium ML8_F2]
MLDKKEKGGESPLDSGPQFSFEDKNSKGWIKRYGSSVILPVIALLILAGGIYLYANQKSRDESFLPSSEQELTADLQGEIDALNQEMEQNGQITQLESEEELDNQVIEIIPAGRKENDSIVEKAVAGNGVTHLARRALKDYLNDKPQEMTNEHKIYIEDYLKDEIGSHPLNIGDEIAFSEDLIKEAIDASMQLTPEQLKNLEKYSALVVSW